MKTWFAVAVVPLAACASLSDNLPPTQPGARIETVQAPVEMAVLAQAPLTALNGSGTTGLARFSVDRGVVTMDLTLANATEGIHAVHLADNGDCSGDGASTGGHWNPTHAAHGRFDAPPFHLGDVGNVRADSSGQASLVFATEEWSIATGQPNDLVGRAVVVEQGKDDFLTQPDGNSGQHITCGVIAVANGLPTAATASRTR